MDETPEQRAIQDKRDALRTLEKKTANKRTAASTTTALFSRERLPEPPELSGRVRRIRSRAIRVSRSENGRGPG
jgi:hypothetical protein